MWGSAMVQKQGWGEGDRRCVYVVRWGLFRKTSLVTFGQSSKGLEGIPGMTKTLRLVCAWWV